MLNNNLTGGLTMYEINEDFCGEYQRSGALDLREDIELIRMRAESVLSGRRLAMIRLYFERGATCREIAAIAGLSEGHTWRIITSLMRRLCDRESLYFIRNRGKFSPDEQKFISAGLFEGMSLRKTADHCGCSVYRVRKAMDKLHRLSKTERNRGA
jgi:hypothetical protein